MLEACRGGVALCRKEEGNHFFVHATDSLDPTKVWTFQAWDTVQQLHDHSNSPHYPALSMGVRKTAIDMYLRQYVGFEASQIQVPFGAAYTGEPDVNRRDRAPI